MEDMFERFTEDAKRVVVLAQEYAQKTYSEQVKTEHILLALTLDSKTIVARALQEFAISQQELREHIEEGRGTSPMRIPYTPRTKKVFELALLEAQQLAHHYVGRSHLMLAIIREGQGSAVDVLHAVGFEDLNRLRHQVIHLMSNPPDTSDDEDMLSNLKIASAHLIEQLDSMPYDQRVGWLADHAIEFVADFAAAIRDDMTP